MLVQQDAAVQQAQSLMASQACQAYLAFIELFPPLTQPAPLPRHQLLLFRQYWGPAQLPQNPQPPQRLTLSPWWRTCP